MGFTLTPPLEDAPFPHLFMGFTLLQGVLNSPTSFRSGTTLNIFTRDQKCLFPGPSSLEILTLLPCLSKASGSIALVFLFKGSNGPGVQVDPSTIPTRIHLMCLHPTPPPSPDPAVHGFNLKTA